LLDWEMTDWTMNDRTMTDDVCRFILPDRSSISDADITI